MADQDARSMMDKVIKETGTEKMSWIGHSMGTTQMFYGLTASPHKKFFSDHLNLFVAYAPVTRLDNVETWILNDLEYVADAIKWITNQLGIYEIFGDLFSKESEKFVCGILPDLCSVMLFWMDNKNTKLDDQDRL